MRQSSAGCGQQNEGLCFGGYDSNWLELTSTEEYNGLTWSAGSNLVTARVTWVVVAHKMQRYLLGSYND